MFIHYLTIAWRNLLLRKANTVINVTGLAIGIAACLLIFRVVQFERGYDTFHDNYKQLYRVVKQDAYPDGIAYEEGMPGPVTAAMRVDFPQISAITEMFNSDGSQITIPSGTQAPAKFTEASGVLFIDTSFFHMFNTRWLAGDASVLAQPGKVVLDKTHAERYFGQWQEATGKIITIDNQISLMVAGVIENQPLNTDIPLSVLVSFSTLPPYGSKYNYTQRWQHSTSNHQVFVLLPAAVTPSSVNKEFTRFTRKYYDDEVAEKKTFFLQPLKDLHFDTRFGNMGNHTTSRTTLLTLALIGVFVVIMAAINFINLCTAQAATRAREIGVRKVLGGRRQQIIFQVLSETAIVVSLALLLAAGIALLAKPSLSLLSSVPAAVPLFSKDAFLFLLATGVVVTLLAGLYPAFILSGFAPTEALKSKIYQKGGARISLRRVLVVTQFAISQVLIIGTIIAVKQMNYIRQADLGFNKDAVLLLNNIPDSAHLPLIASLQQQLKEVSGVKAVSFSSDPPSSSNDWSSNFYFNHATRDEAFDIFIKIADTAYFNTYGLQMIAGKSFTASDTTREVVVNEMLCNKLGIPQARDIIGKDIYLGGKWYPITGVVKDFKASSLREEVRPMALFSRKEYYSTIGVKLSAASLSSALTTVKEIWERTYPEYVYDPSFLDENIADFYKQETQLAALYKLFAGIAILISCLGVYGLISFLAIQKTKEVGIRKTLGASAASIVILFSKEFTLLVVAAFAIAMPVGWWLLHQWLQHFVYRISIEISIFLLAIAASLLIAWITVSYKAVKASLANPVKSLQNN